MLAASLLLAFGSAGAQQAQPTPDEMRQELYTPTSEVSVGLGHLSNDARRLGTYRGIGENGAYGLIDLNLVKRDDDTGTWMKFRGKDIGLDSSEFRLDHERQGDWSYFFQAGEMARKEPLIVNTGLQGLGTATQAVSGTANKSNVDLKVEHNIYALGMRKYTAGGFDIRLSAKQDEATGNRMFGRGTPGAMEFLSEPIDRVTRQWEVVAGYADRKLQLSGGYSGSSYDNNISLLRVNGGAGGFAGVTPFTTNPPMNTFAMPPSNHAHQLHLAGGYNLSDSARTSFKVSRTLAYQNETFDPGFFTTPLPQFAGAPSSLNGKLETTLAYADLSMRPMDRVNLTGSLRFEDRDDQTPEVQYIAVGAANANGAGISGFNKPRSLKQFKGALEASYQFDGGYRLIGSLEREDMKRNGPTAAMTGLLAPNTVDNGVIPIRVAYRAKTDETTQRIEFKRTMSETLNGGIALIHSKRGGSDYVPDTYRATGTTSAVNYSNQTHSLMWADRDRNKVRLTADWIPAEAWSLQMLADFSKDTYSGRNLGPRHGKSEFFAGDLNYRINDNWNLTGWLSQEKIEAKQSARSGQNTTTPGNIAAVFWDADIQDTTRAWGFGIKGKPMAKLVVGADLSRSRNLAEHRQALVGTTSATTLPADLPEFFYSQKSLKMFADYALERNSGIRVNLNVDRRRTNDWTWLNWAYNPGTAVTNDGTTVTNLTSENTTFVGVSYYYRWR